MQTEQLREDRILANAEKSLEELSDVVLDTEHFDKLIDNIQLITAAYLVPVFPGKKDDKAK